MLFCLLIPLSGKRRKVKTFLGANKFLFKKYVLLFPEGREAVNMKRCKRINKSRLASHSPQHHLHLFSPSLCRGPWPHPLLRLQHPFCRGGICPLLCCDGRWSRSLVPRPKLQLHLQMHYHQTRRTLSCYRPQSKLNAH